MNTDKRFIAKNSTEMECMMTHNDFLVIETEVKDHVTRIFSNLNENSLRHLREGFLRRFLMIQTSRIKIFQIADRNRVDNLTISESIDVNIYLNLYYLQLRGALDNLAWSIQYKFDVLDNCQEDKKGNRNKCDLFDSTFLKKFAIVNIRLSAFLKQHVEWSKQVKEFRDPAAHRIPLYIAPGVVTEEQEKEIISIENKRKQYLEKATVSDMLDDSFFDELFSMSDNMSKVGNFIPVFNTSGPSGIKVYGTRLVKRNISEIL